MIEVKNIPVWKNLSLENMDGEVWLPVVGYSESYEVSNFGRVKVLEKVVKRNTGYWTKPEAIKRLRNSKGYLVTTLIRDGLPKSKKAHILVGEAFISNPLNKTQINHKYGDKKDNRVNSLEWATGKENVQHSYEFGLKHGKKGEKHPLAKLKDQDIPTIRRLYSSKEKTSKELARLYGVCRITIQLVCRRKNYSHIK